MLKLTKNDLYGLEKYAEIRADFRHKVMAHKVHRRVGLGDHLFLYFEDRLTMQYQMQEVLRVERVFEPAAIDEELTAYNPLIPDGNNLKATGMLEYPDETERRQALTQLKGIEHKVWIQCQGYERVWAIADEDLERTNDEKTSAVHFLRFELSSAMIESFKQGMPVALGVEHSAYTATVERLSGEVQTSLMRDFD